MGDKLNVSCVQMNCKPGDIEFNLNKAADFASEARKTDTQMLVLPELFDIGYDLASLDTLKINTQKTVDAVSKIARDNNMFIAAGLTENNGEALYNSLYIINDLGEVVEKYRKINLFSLSKENHYFKPGTKPQSFIIKGIKIGIMICYDIRFPELGRNYLKDGCSAILISSAFPKPRQEHWNTLLKARAVENQLYVIASNRTGRVDSIEFAGCSSIIDPWGVVSDKLDDEEGIINSTITMDKVDEVRKLIPCYDDMTRLEGLLRI
ncbi:MAG TPA: nitrilase-related carbon-nitrogen hydrolase [Pseudobacteroides sp.]|uniref:nitrilase-related carbon-nitrogen hydrolase n=1 Tax=Pseudobacteroides sp. TaxID=1968840 RepID=UPI002F94E4EB